MPNLIKQGEARVITKNGEVFVNISLELTIKLDGTNFQALASGFPGGSSREGSVAEPQQEKVNWEIPDFSSSNKIQFGK